MWYNITRPIRNAKRWCGSMAEQLICNQQVVGSTPITSSKKPTRRGRLIMGDFPSGQRGQTVNLLSLTSVVRIHHPPPTKNALSSTDEGAFFELSVPLARNVKYASQVKCTSCVMCAFGTICGTLDFTAPKEQLHCAVRHNFTAACRNFTIEISENMRYNMHKSEVLL